MQFQFHKKNSFFQYAKVDDHLPLMQQLQRAATLPPVEQNGMVGAIVYSMQNRTEFDSCWLESIQEKILCKVKYIYQNSIIRCF